MHIQQAAAEPLSHQLERLLSEAFPPAREPYSPAYKEGVAAVLKRRISATAHSLRYEPGTAEADAFRAGEAEGKAIWRNLTPGKRKVLAG